MIDLEERKSCILIVDDERLNIDLLVSMLKDQYTLKVALGGQQALQRVLSLPKPDMILLDVQMPDINGYQVCKSLKENPETMNIPVIFITAMSEEMDEQHGLSLGAVDYIAKPFKPTIVKMRIHNHLTIKLQRDMLDQLATRDGLTGIANRRRMDDFLEHEWRRAMRTATPISLILLDIDHFKQFNDTHGHATGDECLRQVGRALSHAPARSSDLVARYGGEEFVCILPNTEHDGALIIAERLRMDIELLEVSSVSSGEKLHVTASMGVATMIPTQDQRSETLVKLADGRLYEAKQAGRNRVVGGGSVL